MSSGITDLDRMTAADLLEMHAHAVAMRDLVHEKVNMLGPLWTRLDSLVNDIEAAKWYPTTRTTDALAASMAVELESPEPMGPHGPR